MKRPPSTAPSEFPPPQPPSQRNKKTRELPNISDCNCCNRRINSTNPKNRLGILTSEWRIVLLCRSCYNLVESAQFCSYCLTRVSSEFFDCKKCRRRIHMDCVSKFGYSGNFCGDFSVCFDCWIPNLLENEFNLIRTVRNGISKKELGKNGLEPKSNSKSLSLASSGLCNLQEKGNLLENFKNCSTKELGENGVESTVCGLFAIGAAEKNISVAIDAKEKVFTKEMEAKKGVEVASGALGVVEIDKGGDQGGLVVDKDAELAIRLHKEMNSSRRISRNVCSLSTECGDVPMVNGLVSRGENETSSSGRETRVGFGDDSEKMGLLFCQERNGSSGASHECGNQSGSVCLVSSECPDVPMVNGLVSRGENEMSSSGRETSAGFGDNSEKMGSFFCREKNVSGGTSHECGNKSGSALDGKCNGVSKGCVITYTRKGQAPKVVKCKEEPGIPVKVYCRKSSHVGVEVGEHPLQAVKLDGDEHPFQVVKVETDQCSKTYSRRRLHCKSKLVTSSLDLEKGNLAPDMSLTCLEESKALANGS